MVDAEVKILYRDDSILAAFKPSGILVHRSRLTPERGNLLQELHQQLGVYLYPLHRLDRPTDGIVLFALNSTIAAEMSLAFREQRITKRYLAIVRGWTADEERIDYRVKMKDIPDQQGVTFYRRLGIVERAWPIGRFQTARYSLLEVIPETGRWHQIRKHLHHIAHPIIGDSSYGDSHHNHFFEEHFGIRRLMLSAVTCTFDHPVTGQRIVVQTIPGEDFQHICHEFGWSDLIL